MGGLYVKSDEKGMILHVDANNLYGWAISESWLYDEIKFDKNVELEVTLNTPDDLDI